MRSLYRTIVTLIALAVLGTSAASAQTISMPVISQIGAGLQVGAYAATLSTSQHGGVTVRIETSDPALARVSNAAASLGVTFFEVFVPNGSTSVTSYVHALEDTTGTATITASAPAFTSANRPAVVVEPALDISGTLASIDTLDPADPFSVRVGVPNAGGNLVAVGQPVRAGGSLTATITNSDGAVAQLITTPASELGGVLLQTNRGRALADKEDGDDQVTTARDAARSSPIVIALRADGRGAREIRCRDTNWARACRWRSRSR